MLFVYAWKKERMTKKTEIEREFESFIFMFRTMSETTQLI